MIRTITYRHGRGWTSHHPLKQVRSWRYCVSPSEQRCWLALDELRRRFPGCDLDVEHNAAALGGRRWSVSVYDWDALPGRLDILEARGRRTLRDAVRAVVRMRAEERMASRRRR